MAIKGTYKLTFYVDAESLDQAIDILDKISFDKKLEYSKMLVHDTYLVNEEDK